MDEGPLVRPPLRVEGATLQIVGGDPDEEWIRDLNAALAGLNAEMRAAAARARRQRRAWLLILAVGFLEAALAVALLWGWMG